MIRTTLAAVALCGLLAAPAAAAKPDAPLKVTAKLLKIPGSFPPNELYDYAFVMSYQVVGGPLDKQTIYVAHYNPRIARSKITDKMRSHVKGTLKRFSEGDVHDLVLTAKWRKLKQRWGGRVEDGFFSTDRKGTRYFCLQADPSKTE